MALDLINPLITDIRGPYAGQVFCRDPITHTHYTRKRPLPETRPPATPKQKFWRDAFRSAIYAWIKLTPPQQQIWKSAVNRKYTSGSDCFVHAFLNAIAKHDLPYLEPDPGDGCWPPCPRPCGKPPRPPLVSPVCGACWRFAPDHKTPTWIHAHVKTPLAVGQRRYETAFGHLKQRPNVPCHWSGFAKYFNGLFNKVFISIDYRSYPTTILCCVVWYRIDDTIITANFNYYPGSGPVPCVRQGEWRITSYFSNPHDPTMWDVLYGSWVITAIDVDIFDPWWGD